ncbi:MAG: hypothetical protein JRI23_05330 [Deltaproteobacteria bacterium]|nr:hypothetical protein [Deltaproteobacteria bacterium]MBW2530974.1 hypothetical protein [Deltaproteobacteria bacterium]
MARIASRLLGLAGALVFPLAACGGAEEAGECPPGQIPQGDQCIPQCPPGQTWNGVQCAGQQQCPAGQTWNGTQCVAAQQCAAGQTWDGTQCVSQCPAGQTWNGQQCVAQAAGPAGACNAQRIDAAAAAPVAAILPTLTQAQVPPGAQPVGSAIAGQFTEGQCIQTQVQINSGKCYTIVGAGGPGVTELDIELVPMLPIPGVAIPAVAQDQGSGPNAVLGPKPNCFTNPTPIPAPMNLVIRVRGGQGMAVAQVYEK